MVNEVAARFGRHSNLIGITAYPTDTRTGLTGAVLINSGLVYRAGPGRLHVLLSRHLAERGIPALRFDLSGIGDSAAVAAGSSKSSVWINDVNDAITHLMQDGGLRSVVLFGICAGAVRAYEAALQDKRVRGIVLIDGHIYRTWKTRPLYYLRRIKEGVDWPAVLKRKMGALVGHDSRGDDQAFIDASATLESQLIPKAAFAEGLRQLDSRGTWVAQIMSGAFPTFYNYPSQFADGFRRFGLGSDVSADYFSEADHTFSTPQQQQVLFDFVTRRIGTAASSGAE